MLSIDPDISRVVALRAIRGNLLHLKWHAAALRFELALRRHDRTLKYNYNEAEPRIPKHQEGGGRWTTGLVHLAGDVPTNDPPEPGDPPKIPAERPKTSPERSAAVRLAAKIIGPAAAVAEIAKLSAWLAPYLSGIMSYNDPPASLEELQQAVSMPERGYEIHHIVERTAALADGFSREVVDGRENLARIPQMKHWDINSWYQTPNPDYGGKTPRDYLRGSNWDVRREVGLEALRKFGVLKP